MNQRINLLDSIQTAVGKLSDGNPGAINVCCLLIREEAKIDPDAMFAGIGSLLALDVIGVYGPDIWVLFKDRCGGNVARLCAVLRAHQLGFISELDIRASVSDCGPTSSALDVAGLYAKVKARLPNFDPEGVGAFEKQAA